MYNPGWRNHPNFSWKQNQGGTSECKDPIPSRISGTAAQSAHFSSACIFTSISFGRNNEDIHPIKWPADARTPKVHHDQ
jgi:hypothetical protein